VSLAALFAVGFFLWKPLTPLAEQAWLRNLTIAIAMLLMALPLEASVIGNTLRRPWSTLLAVAVSFGVLPLIAWACKPLLEPSLAGGLLVAAVTPCTMASATVWTRKAGGNDAAATVVTVVTNLICFFITPAWLFILTGEQQEMSLGDMGNMVVRLLVIVVLPVVASQLLRLYAPVAQWATKQRARLGIASQVCILFMVMIGAVHTGESLSGNAAGASTLLQLLLMAVAVMLVHVSGFWIGFGLARLFGLSWGDQLAVAFAGSQKTLMVGMGVSMSSGFSVLPMVTYHVSQLFIDTVLAERLNPRKK
jgi:sodium/bile acid cotransporter 7